MTQFTTFTSRDARLALDIVSPLVESTLNEQWVRRPDFYLMVSKRNSDGTFIVLADKSYGNTVDCENKYKPIATSKTAISARTGLSSREVQTMRPELLLESDTIYWGSAIQGDIIVAGSGVQAFVDETMSKATLAICMMLIQQAFEVLKGHAGDVSGSFYNS